ncbi:MAG: hypothetical protein K6A68_01370 [Clostridiales bacterium]|nr:hypothetical protein [Clostridiales bacterium]
MVIFVTLMIFGIIGFGVPRKHLQGYMIFAAFCISSLYLFFTPRPTWDLARHYEVLHALRKCDFLSVVTGNIHSSNALLMDYADHSRVYAIYAYLISKLNYDGLLPAITGFIIYSTVSRIIMMAADDVGQDIEDWKISFCFFFLLAALDFRTISGIRNMLAYALFCYVLYRDLVRNGNKMVCLLIYLILANLHSTIYIYLVIRILVAFSRIISEWILGAFILALYPLQELFTHFLERFSHIEMVSHFLVKSAIYTVGGGTQAVGSFFIIWILRIFLTLLYLFLYTYAVRKIQGPKKFQMYGRFYLYAILFAFGAVRQLDIFLRNDILMYFLIYPFLLLILKNLVAETPLEIIIPDDSKVGFLEVIICLMILVIVVFSLIIYMAGFYPPMDSGFHLRLMR